MNRLWVFVLFAGVASAADWRAMLAPGPVHTSHAEHAGNCDACHSAFDGIPDERCLSCHEPIAARLGSGEGWHASVAGQPCLACHTDHHGPEASPTRKDALAAFDHAATGFPLTDGHAGKACADCHAGSLARLDQGCAACHGDDDAHQSELGPTCDACHTPTSWTTPRRGRADHATALDGGHAGAECADCHRHGDHLEPAVACASCHPDGHDGTVTPCSDCHEVAAWKPAKFDHGPCTCAFPGEHQTAACLDCHAGFDFTDTPTACGGCHQPGAAHEPLGECARCHDALSWSERQFDHNKLARFQLVDRHLAVSCDMCHTEAGHFRGAPTSCEGCHTSAAHPDFTAMKGGCASCHATTGFAPSTFDHAATGFALTGKHATAACADCH